MKRYEYDTEELFVEDIYPMRLARKIAREQRRKRDSRRTNPHSDGPKNNGHRSPRSES
jgi:hypothetical protein